MVLRGRRKAKGEGWGGVSFRGIDVSQYRPDAVDTPPFATTPGRARSLTPRRETPCRENARLRRGGFFLFGGLFRPLGALPGRTSGSLSERVHQPRFRVFSEARESSGSRVGRKIHASLARARALSTPNSIGLIDEFSESADDLKSNLDRIESQRKEKSSFVSHETSQDSSTIAAKFPRVARRKLNNERQPR